MCKDSDLIDLKLIIEMFIFLMASAMFIVIPWARLGPASSNPGWKNLGLTWPRVLHLSLPIAN